MSDREEGQDAQPKRASLLSRRTGPYQPVDIYDHAIGLVDTTVAGPTSSGDQTPIQRITTEDARRRDRVRASVRGEYNRQKWRRYQKERVGGKETGGEETDNDDDRDKDKDVEAGQTSKDTYGRSTIRRNYDWVRDKIPLRQKAKEKAAKKEDFEIDILYENQRGMFFCGIPLYSHQSLLNFDPPAWQTREFKESPVNITNAQPPDPTWAWCWKCWYVDMSHDVDEEGWEYSLSFQQGFAWHGTHPWFHSFVRRRRWLRKRVKVKPRGTGGKVKDALHESHLLNRDYFTIHSASRETSTNRVPTLGEMAATSSNNQRYSVITSKSYMSEEEEETPEEIKDVTALMKALKTATVDRKKLSALRAFLANAGPELHYLPDQIPEIMHLFIYQTSRRRVVTELQQAVAAVGTSQDRSLAERVSESDGATDLRPSPLPSRGPSGTSTPLQGSIPDQRRALERAIEAAHEHIRNCEYWSDVKKTLTDAESLDVPPPPPAGTDYVPPKEALSDVGKHDSSSNASSRRPSPLPRQRSENQVHIRGIPEAADVGQETGITRRVTLQMKQRGDGNGGGSGNGTSERREEKGEEQEPEPEQEPITEEKESQVIEQSSEVTESEERTGEGEEEEQFMDESFDHPDDLEGKEEGGKVGSADESPPKDKGKGKEKA